MNYTYVHFLYDTCKNICYKIYIMEMCMKNMWKNPNYVIHSLFHSKILHIIIQLHIIWFYLHLCN